jgi:hypothetical protein
MKLPGISKIKSLFAALAFAPNNSKHTEELFSFGGTDYMTARAREMLTQRPQPFNRRSIPSPAGQPSR